MPGGWMPQATRLPFTSSIGVHTQAGRRSPRRTRSTATASETSLGIVSYLRKVTTWKEHIDYERPGPPGCLLAQHSATAWGTPRGPAVGLARLLSEPGAWGPWQRVPSPPSPRLRASAAGSPGTHVPASPRSSAQTEGSAGLARRAAAARAHGDLCAQRPLCPPALTLVPNGTFQVKLGQVFAVGFGERPCRSPGFRAGGEPRTGTGPSHTPGGVQRSRGANTREGPASTRHKDPEPSVQEA